MKKKERKFIEKSIIELVKANKHATIDQITDYLDYVNKVRYDETELEPILDSLILEQKLIYVQGAYQKS